MQQDSIIYMDIVLGIRDPQVVTALCVNINNTHQQLSASANADHVLDWGPGGGMSGEVKISVGSAEFLADYNIATGKVELIGVCGSTSANNFSVNDNTTLVYDTQDLSFTVRFELVDNARIDIIVRPSSACALKSAQ